MALIYLFIIMSSLALIGIIMSCIYLYRHRNDEEDDEFIDEEYFDEDYDDDFEE